MLLRLLSFLPQFETPGGPSGGSAPAAPEPPPAAPPASPPPPAAAASGAGSSAGKPSFDDWLADPVNAEYTRALRKEAAENRVKAQTATKTAEGTLRELAKGLGIEIPGGDPLDPARLTDELAKTRRENVELRVSGALGEAFTKYGAKPKLTRALLMDEGALRDLDPAAPDFQRNLNAVVKKAVEDNPELKADQASAPRRPAGAEFPGGGQPPSQQLTKAHLDSMKPNEIAEAVKKGQFDELLGRTKSTP